MTAAPAVVLTPTVGATARRLRVAGIVALAVLALAVGGLATSGALAAKGAFAPDSAAPTGAKALASVLAEQGVAVRTVTDLADAERSPGGTLFVDDRAALLTTRQWRRLAAAVPALVIADPSDAALAAVGPDVATAPLGASGSGMLAARCALPLAVRARTLDTAGASTALRIPTSGVEACFPDARADQL